MNSVSPAPVAAEPQAEEVVEENLEVAAELQEAAPAPPEPAPRPIMAADANASRDPIPPREEFPPIAREEMAARPEKLEQVAQAAQTKRKGLLERLASVGLGVRREEDPASAPKKAAKEDPKMQHPQPEGNVHPLQPAIDPSLDDDQLEIPAFLRRQSN